MNKAIFFDRDGVINTRIFGGYITRWNEFHFLPDIGETLAALKTKGYLAIVITNQRGVGLDLMTQDDLDEIHAKMQDELQTKYGAKFDDIICCTDATNESLRRKPSPAMILEAQGKWDIDLSESWFIGDTKSDITAGNRAGTKTAFLLNDHENPPNDATILLEKVFDILKHL
jgi:D-glycero-D-manno-heptose 1,7-bisphosphate phosphatase